LCAETNSIIFPYRPYTLHLRHTSLPHIKKGHDAWKNVSESTNYNPKQQRKQQIKNIDLLTVYVFLCATSEFDWHALVHIKAVVSTSVLKYIYKLFTINIKQNKP